ncbi:hypothetical protein Smp_043570 [Schistosoma mansoni]|uniref:hypothetical protein n=1 Tax=Schistosoma mansoni TaxID=6183 RepID=UPI0001A644FE|nr:hypothetical protein Smp_043570 [Schistosoma mansoni]|eukprot:XP_018652705.1 hypothetical protein Smp_043570 [Schistosoma mansoni]
MPLNAEYARELRAVFKILEFSIGVGLIVSIVVADRYRITVAGAFLTFFALVGALTSLFFFVVHLSSLIYKIPGPVTLIDNVDVLVATFYTFLNAFTEILANFNDLYENLSKFKKCDENWGLSIKKRH